MRHRLLFRVVAARHESDRSSASRIDRPAREWYNPFQVDNTLPPALIDRLMQYEEAIVIQGANYRMRDNATDSPSGVTQNGAPTSGGVFSVK